MHIEQTILVVGCQQSVLDILGDAFKSSDIQVIPADYGYKFNDDTQLKAVLIYLNESDIDSARKFLALRAVSKLQKILVIDPRNQALRLFSATVEIDDVVFKPVRVQELVARIQLIIQRDNILAESKYSICDELDFAQKIQTFADEKFCGCLNLKGQELESDIFFDHGIIRGIRAERKIQSNAADALWRIFPANHSVEKNAPLPAWAEKEKFSITAKELISRVIDAASFFHDRFADKYSLHTVFRISTTQYDAAFPKLPRQVRQIIQTFDGSRELFEVLNTLNLSEMLTMQIILRLLQEKLIRECKPCNESVSLSEWIQSDTTGKKQDDDSDIESRITSVLSAKPFSETQETNPVEEATPSVVMFIDQLVKAESTVVSEDSTPSDHASTKKETIVKTLSASDHEEEKVKSIAYPLLSSTSNEEDKKAAVSALMAAVVENTGNVEAHNHDLPEPILTEINIQPGKPHSDYVSSDSDSKSNRTQIIVKPGEALSDISAEPEPIAYKSEKADLVDEYSSASDEDSSATADFVMPFRPAADLEPDVTSKIDVVDYLNKESAHSDENKTEELSADIVVPEKKKPLALDSDADGEDSFEDSDWFDTDSDKDTMRLKVDDSFSAEALYKENHKEELSPSEWKNQVLQRLDDENKSRDKVIMGALIFAIVAAIIVLIIISSDSKPKGNQPLQNTTETSPQKNLKSDNAVKETKTESGEEGRQAIDSESAASNQPEVALNQPGLEIIPDEEIVEPNNGEPTENTFEIVPDESAVAMNNATESDSRVEGNESDLTFVPVFEIDPAAVESIVQVEEPAPEPVIIANNMVPTDPQTVETSPKTADTAEVSSRPHRSRRNTAPESNPQKTTPKTSGSTNNPSMNVLLQPVRDAINRKDWNSAYRELKPLLDKNPNNTTMLNMAVQILMKQNKFDEALEYSKKLESSSSSKPTYWMQRAKIHKSLGQTDKADQAIDKAIAIVGANTAEGERYRAQKTKKEPLVPLY
ncbi:MAG: hypothetical protein IJU23_09630 [Proteobacteria bacterium]|nr:hypothetical protein [Pseudomonadota bacterium]